MKKMNLQKIALVLLFGILFIQMVSAEISQSSFVVKIYNGTLEIKNNEYAGNNRVYSFNISNNSIEPVEFNYDFLFVKNTTVSTDIVDKYAECLNQKSECEIQKSAINLGWNGCIRDLNNAGNISGVQGNLTNCQNTLQQKDTDINSRQTELDKCKNEQQSKSNVVYLWAIAGIVLGIVGTLMQQKKIKFGGGVKEKAHEEFNPDSGS